MSMFRRPGDDSSSSSSSSSESSSGQVEDPELSASHQDSVLSRINTLDSAGSGSPIRRHAPPYAQLRQNSAQDVRDLLLHSLLEEKAVTQAAEQLGRDRSDPDVQRLGRETYRELALQISDNIDVTYASDEMQGHRRIAQDGINKLTRSNLTRLAQIPEGSQALVTRPQSGMVIDEVPQPLPSVLNDLSNVSLPGHIHLPDYPGLSADHYVRNFTELEMVGKGGYGKVFKVKHHLDGSFYAVKRIAVSPSKLAKIQEHGAGELESMLEEVRSLARFEHNNIVRYHNAWLEFTSPPADASHLPATTVLQTNRLLEDPATFSSGLATTDDLPMDFNSLTFDVSFGQPNTDNGGDIVFETSDTGGGAQESRREDDYVSMKESTKPRRRDNRRGSQAGSYASQATVATTSSTKSRMSAVEDADEQEDEVVETIPRTHMPYSHESHSELSESMVSDSEVSGHVVSAPSSEPVLTLNVQMSLYNIDLASFLSSEWSSFSAQETFHHCFHTRVALELLSNIISGVEYLHTRGVVHRDLKPANIFLSLSDDRYPPYGSVDLSTCKPCPQRSRIHVTPRIGDFGLVALLGDKGMNTSTRPVGTEFYRPDTSKGISEKLDVFALGVIGFEMLQRFGTRMERVEALNGLRHGKFPDDFAENIGGVGDHVQQLIGDMVHPDEQKRMSCEQVQDEIKKLVHILTE